MDPIAFCRALALHTEEPGFTTRTFLSEAMHAVHSDLCRWMSSVGMSVRVDAAGNLRGKYEGATPDAPLLYIGSHLDTVPHAGAFDGPLGVVLGVKLIELLHGKRLRFGIEVVGFSEEEGVRFGFPFIGSLAFIGELDAPEPVKEAIRGFGLNPDELAAAVASESALGYLEFHIEQGPALESVGASLGVVEAIVGQSRLELIFEGKAGHAGTTPMHLRQDALVGAAEWICAVEHEAFATPGLVATVGRIEAQPGAPNVIAGVVKTSLDVRHKDDAVRHAAVKRLVGLAQFRDELRVTAVTRLDQAAVALDSQLTDLLAKRVPHRMLSGAGHDAMIVARKMPAAMLFLRSPGGLSHHPDESVLAEDVETALRIGMQFLEDLGASL
jgi:allantoate deiminase